MSTAKRRQLRTRRKIREVQALSGSPRLSVFRSNKHIYVQVIDDKTGKTVAAASSAKLASGSKTEVASAVGKAIAEAAVEKGVKQVILDRGAYRYHGRVKALADAAREGGLDF